MLDVCIPVVAVALLQACSTLPGHGPQGSEISLGTTQVNAAPLPYLVVPVDAVTVSRSNHYQPASFGSGFREAFRGSHALTVGVGDQLRINIWEPTPDGVFATPEKKLTSLTASVDEDGMIYIPYAGRVNAQGRRVEGLRLAIEDALRGKAVEPQVQVVLEENAANRVVLVGDVARPGTFPIPLRGLRLMEAIAQAGGTTSPVFETSATISRGRHQETVRLDQAAKHPVNNIRLAPSDSVVVEHQPRTYSVFGAVQQAGHMAFKGEKMTLAEALASVRGLRNDSADPRAIFLFRFEDAELVKSLERHPGARGTSREAVAGAAPVAFRLDLNQPDAFFLAQKFMLKDKDVLYVANHPTAELGKFLSMLAAPFTGTARTAASFGD